MSAPFRDPSAVRKSSRGCWTETGGPVLLDAAVYVKLARHHRLARSEVGLAVDDRREGRATVSAGARAHVELRERPVIGRDAALVLAEHGWLVLPVAPGGKRPLTPHGWRDATPDPAVIARWPQRVNVGVACEPSGLLVVDVDPRNGGDDALHERSASWASCRPASSA